MVWEFYPKGEQLVVNPGGVYEMVFVASNLRPSDVSASGAEHLTGTGGTQYFPQDRVFLLHPTSAATGAAH